MHIALCATPCAAGMGKKSVWSLHHCSVHILLFVSPAGLAYCLLMFFCYLLMSQRNGNSLSENPPAYDDNIEDGEGFNSQDGEGSNSQTHSTTEELTFDSHIAELLLPYRRILEEMRNHHMEEELQRARHLSLMLKWTVVDCSLFKGSKFCPNLHKPAVNMILLESFLMETKNKHLHHTAMIVHNLIAKGIIDSVNSGI